MSASSSCSAARLRGRTRSFPATLLGALATRDGGLFGGDARARASFALICVALTQMACFSAKRTFLRRRPRPDPRVRRRFDLRGYMVGTKAECESFPRCASDEQTATAARFVL